MNPPARNSIRTTRAIGFAVIAFAMVAAACGGSGSDDRASSAPGAAALPAIALQTFDGSPEVMLDDFLGKPLVVNFWASWCPSCVAEMSAAFRPVQEQLGDSVNFVGVNI